MAVMQVPNDKKKLPKKFEDEVQQHFYTFPHNISIKNMEIEHLELNEIESKK